MYNSRSQDSRKNLDVDKTKFQDYKILDIKSYEEIKEIIEDYPNEIIVIKFYTNRCKFCKDYIPIYEQFNKNYGQHLIFTQANIEDDLLFSYKFRVSELPTTMIIKNGIFYYKEVGLLEYSYMKNLFESLKNLKLEINK